MRTMQLRQSVAAPPDVVWQVITDLQRSPDFVSGIDGIEVVAGGGSFGIGTRWRETRTLFGRTATEEMEVTGVDEGRSYTVQSDGAGAHYEWTLTVRPAGESISELVMDFGAEPRTLVARTVAATVGRLFERTTKKAIGKDLEDMAAEARRRAATTGA